MHNKKFLELLVVLMSITLFSTCYGSIGYRKKCAINSTAEVEKYDRVLVFVGETIGKSVVKLVPWPKVAHEYHKLAGRRTRSQIIQKGRKALDQLKTMYGLNASPLITDDQIYNGVDVSLGDYTFVTRLIYYKVGLYRLIIESHGKKAHYYDNPPEVKGFFFGFIINNPLTAGGILSNTLYPGEILAVGDYIITAKRGCSLDGFTVITFISHPINKQGGFGIIKHNAYGTGTFQMSFVIDAAGFLRTTNVLRFPK